MTVSGRRIGKALGVSVGAFVLFGVVTGLVPNPIYTRMVARTPLDYLFLLSMAGLLGIYSAQDAAATGDSDDRFALLGSVGGFLAFGCPVCNAFLLALFSSSALMTYFDPLRPLLGAVAVAGLGGLVSVRYSRRCRSCSASSRATVSEE